MKKNIWTTIALILLFLGGLSVLLYPAISDYINSKSQSRAIASYSEALAQLSETDYSEMLEAAQKYNEALLTNPARFAMNDQQRAEYFSILDFSGTGVIGTMQIDAIKVNLPIYLGTEENTLQVGLGHLEGSSFPIGGKGTHSVISGHRGLPSSTLLTDADKLAIGDVFVLKILNETLYYEIEKSFIVLPENLDNLKIDPNEDYCTLVTCTPVGVNSHRLLLRGKRIFPDNEEEALKARNLRADARPAGIFVQYAIAAVPVIIAALILMLVQRKKRKKS
ncbi:MAG: class C sortase [Oscillospiraceae bacterium]|nr:class C sortase [Oscillospiraceae bacterium]